MFSKSSSRRGISGDPRQSFVTFRFARLLYGWISRLSNLKTNFIYGHLHSNQTVVVAMTRIKIGLSSDIPLGTAAEISAQDRTFAVANVSGEFFAIDGICSHQGGHLGKGKLKDYVLKCPRHGSEFDVRTGKNLKGPWIPFGKATDLNAYKVSKEGEDLYVEI